jgi:CheY-like chemotaxis protein
MYILVVEDDYLQSNLICEKLRNTFHANVKRLSTEMEFRQNLDELARNRPDVIIMDVMLRWTDPSPEVKIPPREVRKEGFYRAGIRCTKLLAEREETKGIPVILYTILERTDLENQLLELSPKMHVIHLRKESEVDRLIESIREFRRH